MAKVDFKKDKKFYAPSAKAPNLIEIPQYNFLMVDGEGAPESKLFQAAVEALYSVSYTIKMMPKKGIAIPNYYDYVVAPLEGLWWSKDIETKGFDPNRDNWLWTLMIRQPEFVSRVVAFGAIQQVLDKKQNPMLEQLKFVEWEEGKSAQIMHVGPFKNEGPTVENLHNFIKKEGLKLNGKHHEIYLSDMRKTAPEKLKTIIRYPVKPS